MLLALFLVPLASLMWGITNHIDKHLISNVSNNGDYRGLIVFSSIGGALLFPLSLILSNFKIGIDLISFIMIFISASMYLIATIFYFKALEKNDASLVTAMFQLIPVFGYFLGLIFLNETLKLHQIIGGIIVILSSIAIIFEFKENKFDKKKLIALILMSLSSLFYAIYFLFFRLTTIDNNFYAMTFWYQISLVINGILIIIFFKKFRNGFFSLIKNNGKNILGFNLLNEALNTTANLLVNFSITIAPMALVLTLNGLQPFFVFLIGLIGTLLMPKSFNEDMSKRVMIQKIICIVISIIGLAILYY